MLAFRQSISLLSFVAAGCCALIGCSSSSEPRDHAAADSTSASTAPPKPVLLEPVRISGTYMLLPTTTITLGTIPYINFLIDVVNSGTSAMDVKTGGCYEAYKLYATSSRTGTPAFDSDVVGQGCLASLTEWNMQPAGVVHLGAGRPVREVLAAGTRPGHYYASIRISVNGADTTLAAGDVDVSK